MFNLVHIAKNNYATFYDFDTGRRQSICFRLALIASISLIISSFNVTNFTEFLNSVLSVEAILVGFSFSVMFFLLSEGGTLTAEPKTIEDKLAGRKLATLQREIFYNVSYFNMTAVAVVLISLLLLLPTFDFLPWKSALQMVEANIPFDLKSLARLGSWVQWGLNWLLWFLFYLFLLESLFTFIRTVGRVSYYFNNKVSRLNQR